MNRIQELSRKIVRGELVLPLDERQPERGRPARSQNSTRPARPPATARPGGPED